MAAVGTVARPLPQRVAQFQPLSGPAGAFPGEEPPVCLHPEAEELLGHGWGQQEGEGSLLYPGPRARLGTGTVPMAVPVPVPMAVPVPQFKRRVQESTQVLRELEISLRTNYIG